MSAEDLALRLENLRVSIPPTIDAYAEEGRLLKTRIDYLTHVNPPSPKGETERKRAEERMDEIVDRLIVLADHAWKDYRQLEQGLGGRGLDSSNLEQVRDICQKAEDLMTSLLCYSLSNFRDKGR
jgi:hypothetical protein